MAPAHWLLLQRTVRFGDTDAAGVMHFHQLLRWCHEAYEESLESFGIPAAAIFPTPNRGPAGGSAGESSPVSTALPIVHCQADYLAPLICGDQLTIALRPQRLEAGSFELGYCFTQAKGGLQPVARGLTRHVAIDPLSRRRCDLPRAIAQWLEASAEAAGRDPFRGSAPGAREPRAMPPSATESGWP
ncbi:acyl-CoA thioesterase [Synechococcus sp. CS-1329]|uniref:acyl-CoA thioesterase n=1 Tax=Synechococcus sp. CS-1329 TaxID=2847975 RepID=UPI00223B092A|nr:thioesterase family protein [Synechococcus sp. CS-1329]MCT0219424.1 acyl-CoA thioesterase [Synechococcus sp. CS-1329]